MPEIWKNVKGYNGTYQVSNLGKVRRIAKDPKRTHLIKIMRYNNSRSLLVGLSKNSKLKRFTLSKLVAATFIPHPAFKNRVIHKDHNYKNNQVSNLEWINSAMVRRKKNYQQRIRDNHKYWQKHHINGEVWKDVPLFHHRYQVSNLGRVRSKNRYTPVHKLGYSTLHLSKLMSITINKENYPVVNFKTSRKQNIYFVHRLVAKAFVPNPHHYRIVIHKDGNPKNNQASNLKWASQRKVNHS